MNGDDVTHGRGISVLTFFRDHRGFAGAGVIGDIDDGAQLDHGRPPLVVDC